MTRCLHCCSETTGATPDKGHGALALQTDGEGSKVLKRGDAVYVAPNVVHRGVNVSRTQAAKLVVVRVKPKDEPLTKEVQP
jgi:quercetin dioxygenase-like cupin family protein